MSEGDRVVIHVRLPRGLVKRIDHAAVETGEDRARAVERLVELGLSYTRPAAVQFGDGGR